MGCPDLIYGYRYRSCFFIFFVLRTPNDHLIELLHDLRVNFIPEISTFWTHPPQCCAQPVRVGRACLINNHESGPLFDVCRMPTKQIMEDEKEPTTLGWDGVLAVGVLFASAPQVSYAIARAEVRTCIKLKARTEKTRKRYCTCTY